MSRENRGRNSDALCKYRGRNSNTAIYIFVFWDAIRMQPYLGGGVSSIVKYSTTAVFKSCNCFQINVMYFCQ